MPQYFVYILHTERKLANHAQHYCGATDQLLARLIAHATGRGAKITQAFLREGIEWRVASVFIMTHRCHYLAERRVKRRKKTCLFCEVCSGDEMRCITGATPVDVQELGIPLDSASLRAYAAKMAEAGSAVEPAVTDDEIPF